MSFTLPIRLFLAVFVALNLFIDTKSQEPLLSFPPEHKLKIAFGSCNRFYQTDESTIFNTISEYKPDIFAWLGDVAYVEDMVIFYVYFKFPGIETARKRLEASKNEPAYEAFRKSFPIIGVWDNHDYGCDGGDKTFPHKYEMRDAFLDFLDEPIDSPRRKREGVYESYTIKLGELRINLVLLDVRFNKDPITKDILGEEQWNWLEKEFQKGDDFYLIGSGSQILPDDRILHDNWYTESSKRLVKLIQKYSVPALLLTGDIHLAEILPLPCSESILGYQLYELTSSGLTHTSRDHFDRGELFDKLFFPETYNKGKERYVDLNFGDIEIEANTENKYQTKIKFEIRDLNGSVVMKKEILLADLQRKKESNIDIDSYKDSLCFNDSTKEQRFLNHFINAILTKEIFMWLAPSLLKVGLVLSVFSFLFYRLIKLCCSRKSKAKTD